MALPFHMSTVQTIIDDAPTLKQTTNTISDFLVALLKQIDIEFVFGVPGGAIEPFFDALARQSRQPLPHQETTPYVSKRQFPRQQQHLRLIVARHESGAAFMADGYARETGRIAVCCATTGPGTTNLVTGVASAYADRVPMLVITAQTALPNFGRRGLQESSSDAVDTVAMLDQCTKYSTLVSHPLQLRQKLVSAIVQAYQHPRGPVHLGIPLDVLRSETDISSELLSIAPMLREPNMVDIQAFNDLWRCVSAGEQLVLYLGADCGKSITPIIRFAEETASPIITTPMGKRWVSAYHPLNHGVFGFAGHDSARAVLTDPKVKYILAVGASMGELGTSGWSEECLLNHKLIHIDSNRENFIRSPMACLHVYGNITQVFSQLLSKWQEGHQSKNAKTDLLPTRQGGPVLSMLLDELPSNICSQEQETYYSNATPLKPQRIMYFLANNFPENSRIICDAGNSWAWATHYLHLRYARRYHIGMGFGTMAWAIGASIGVALAHRGIPTICLTGDGSFLMSSQEMTVAIQERLPIIFIILNDQALGMVKHGQRLGGGEPIGFELPPVDFAGLANALGAQGFSIRNIDDLNALDIESLCHSNGPSLLDIHIDPEEIPPMGSRMKVLKSA